MCYSGPVSTEPDIARHALEERITHCERLADTLNEVITDLQRRVSELERQNRKLLAELQQQQEASRALGLDSERPPHY